MTTIKDRYAGSEVYDCEYYGVGGKKANYDNYGPWSVPHWARPIAQFIREHGSRGAILDVGCAYGHLVRELNTTGLPAMGIEWSEWATDNKVSPNVERGDARALPYTDRMFTTIVSLDLLEHFEPEQSQQVMREMVRVSRAGALHVHLIGAYDPQTDLSQHLSDPTHVNHEPLSWYVNAFAALGVTLDPVLTTILQTHPVFAPTDWAGRILAFRG